MVQRCLGLMVLLCLWNPGAGLAQTPRGGAAPVLGASSPQQWGESPGADGSLVERALLAAGGAFVGAFVGGYGAWALKGGSSGCDLCWEAAAGLAAGGMVGGAWATTLADGSMRRALLGSVVGAAAGLAVVGVLDYTTDTDESLMTLSFAVPYSLLTGFFSGR